MITDTEYSDIVIAQVLTDSNSKNAFIKKMTEATNGRILIEDVEKCYYAIVNGTPVIFDF